ncbi:MAG: hypothetical protein FJ025_00505 [Chloroflexi bacterium]|nr:hypothetical protein [Chloroflexota bacterium]
MKRLPVLLAVVLLILLPLASGIGCREQPSPITTPPPTTTPAPPANNPPDKPVTPSGSTSGQTELSYTYNTSSTDADGDAVKYIFNWGDGGISETGFLSSGTVVSESHIWSRPGTYLVAARAVDGEGASSGWSDAREVTITLRTYTLTSIASPSYAGSVTPVEGSFESGKTVVVTAEPNTGYVFNRWGGDATGSANPINITMNADKNIIAHFNLIPKAEPVLEWWRTFGGVNADGSRSVQQTADGGYIISGYTSSYGAGFNDVYLIRTDANGYEVWEQTFGGEKVDSGYSGQLTTDGGYIIVGETQSFSSGYSDLWLIKTDPYGGKLWDKTFGGLIPEWGWSVQQTTDGGYIISGTVALIRMDIWLIKTDASGTQLWNNAFSGGSIQAISSVHETEDGGYIIVGDSLSPETGTDIWLIRTDSNGKKMWERKLGGSDYDYPHSFQQTADGGYIIVGETKSYGAGDADVWLIKTDRTGYKMWDKTFGGEQRDSGYSVQQTADGGYIVVGETKQYGADEADVWLIKVDSDGNKEWDKTFGGKQRDIGYSVQQTADGGYIIAGETESYGAGGADVWLLKVSVS